MKKQSNMNLQPQKRAAYEAPKAWCFSYESEGVMAQSFGAGGNMGGGQETEEDAFYSARSGKSSLTLYNRLSPPANFSPDQDY